MYRIGFDVGGTFTDFTAINTTDGAATHFKTSSTPHDPSEAIETGLRHFVEERGITPDQFEFVGHGTTVATNMVIERRGVPTGLITTQGARDVLEIGRQTRPHLYDYDITKPEPLVERYMSIEVPERMNADGDVLIPLDEDAVRQAAEQIRDAGMQAVAICFLHAYRDGRHERRAAEIVREVMPDAYISVSSDVLPEFREFERFSTLFIIAVSAVFGWIISIQRLPVELVSLMEGLFVSKAAAIAVVIAILLVVGMFMEVLAALVLLVPTLLAIATTFDIDTVHLGVTVVVTMMIGTITPPVGLVLYTVMSVAGIKMGELTRALLPFYLTLVIVALLVAFVPQITMFLPDLLMPQAQ